jgi:predicted nucleic acid-binding protein
LILRNLLLIAPIKLNTQICEDHDDDIFIACAMAADASHIISGDKLLLKVDLPRIKIMTVSGFKKIFPF